MKHFYFFLTFSILSVPAMAQTSIEERVNHLEAKVVAMETAIKTKLAHCKLTYKHHAYRLNLCDKGTFARSIQNVGNGANQLECGYYRLECGSELIAGQ